MTDQEIINAIDAEMAAAERARLRIRYGSPGASESTCGHIGYVNGLNFARELIVKQMEASQ